MMAPKRLLSAFFLIVCAAVAGCGADPVSAEPISHALNLTGTWNGQPWSGSAAAYISGDSIHIRAYSLVPNRENYSFFHMSTPIDTARTYAVIGNAGHVVGGDGVAAPLSTGILSAHSYTPPSTVRGLLIGFISLQAVSPNPSGVTFQSGMFQMYVYSDVALIPCFFC